MKKLTLLIFLCLPYSVLAQESKYAVKNFNLYDLSAVSDDRGEILEKRIIDNNTIDLITKNNHIRVRVDLMKSQTFPIRGIAGLGVITATSLLDKDFRLRFNTVYDLVTPTKIISITSKDNGSSAFHSGKGVESLAILESDTMVELPSVPPANYADNRIGKTLIFPLTLEVKPVDSVSTLREVRQSRTAGRRQQPSIRN